MLNLVKFYSVHILNNLLRKVGWGKYEEFQAKHKCHHCSFTYWQEKGLSYAEGGTSTMVPLTNKVCRKKILLFYNLSIITW